MPATRDQRFMAAALRLARHHLGQTGANPSVACLIVRDDVVVGRGVTARGGRPHAETIALAEAGPLARGATAYVTLEPCSHHGHTPPCADALTASGVARVVVAVTDPDRRVSGRGLALLRSAGIAVTEQVLEAEGRSLLSGYLMRQLHGRPEVILKLAVSADGGIGRAGAGQVAITGPLARAQGHILRAECDAILIGVGTALADDPELTCRLPGLEKHSPRAIVLDPALAVQPHSRLCAACKPPFSRRLTIVCEPGADSGARRRLEAVGAEVLPVGTGDLPGLMRRMAGEGVSRLIVEGGAKTAARFLDGHLVDTIKLFTAPMTIGEGMVASPFTSDHMPEGFARVATRMLGPDRMDDYERLA